MQRLKASFRGSPIFRNNSQFDRTQTEVPVRDNQLDRYYHLSDLFEAAGHSIATVDIVDEAEADILIVDNVNLINRSFNYSEKPSYLLLTEPPVVIPNNYDPAQHRQFKRVFTWHDGLVDGDKYIKLCVPQKFPESVCHDVRSEFCNLIARNKRSSLPNELYSKRVEIIRWFERHHLDQFDLYGQGWDDYRVRGPKPLRAINRIPAARRLMFRFLGERFPSYRGSVESKFDVLKQYKFSICYENNENVPGYITEKIFHAFFAGTVPVYLGAPNVTDYIPKDCFIDQRDFASYEHIYEYMTSLTDADLSGYRIRIDAYLNSAAARQFRSEVVARVMAKTILDDATPPVRL